VTPRAGHRADPRLRTVFFGSGLFAVPILEQLAARPDLVLVAVVTPPDRPAGRGGALRPPPAAVAATRLGLRRLPLAKVRSPEGRAAISALRADLGILADFGQIIPPDVLEAPRHGILNVHPSLLPRHRGATPIQATILEGDATAGVSVMQMDAGLDTGPVLGRRTWALHGGEMTPDLEAHAAAVGAELLGSLLAPYLDGALTAVAQDPAGATMTRPLRREDGRLDPARPADELERHVRAYQPWPGSQLETPAGRLTVLRATATASLPGDRAGALLADGDGLALATADGRLRLLEVKPAGGRVMSGADYRRGHPAVLGEVVR
jgi:methionyl-tRNA formyltransferase